MKQLFKRLFPRLCKHDWSLTYGPDIYQMQYCKRGCLTIRVRKVEVTRAGYRIHPWKFYQGPHLWDEDLRRPDWRLVARRART